MHRRLDRLIDQRADTLEALRGQQLFEHGCAERAGRADDERAARCGRWRAAACGTARRAPGSRRAWPYHRRTTPPWRSVPSSSSSKTNPALPTRCSTRCAPRASSRAGAPAGEAALTQADDAALVILDVGLPDISGFEVFKRLRAREPTLPILFLTARADEIDRVVGLELGADDYVTKPFSPRELVARVRTVLRRSALPAAASAAPPSTAFACDDGKRLIHYYGHRARPVALRIRPAEDADRPPRFCLHARAAAVAGLGRRHRQPGPHGRCACEDAARQVEGRRAVAGADPHAPRRGLCVGGGLACHAAGMNPFPVRPELVEGPALALRQAQGERSRRKHDEAQPRLRRDPARLRDRRRLADVAAARRHRSALPRVGRGVAGRDRAPDGRADRAALGRARGHAGRAGDRRGGAGAAVPRPVLARAQRQHLRLRENALRAAHDGGRCQRPRRLRFARPRGRRRPLAVARREARARRPLRRAHHARRGQRCAHRGDVRRRAAEARRRASSARSASASRRRVSASSSPRRAGRRCSSA